MSATEVKGIPIREATERLDSKTVLLSLTFHCPGIYRPGDLGEITTSADKAMLSLSKRLVRSQDYIDMGRIATYCQDWLRNVSVPVKVLRRGTYKVPISRLEYIMEELKNREAEYMEAGKKFVVAWPDLIARSPELLQGQFRQEDLPTQEHIKQGIWVEYYLTEQAVPGESKLGMELFREERDKAQQRARAEVENTIQALRVSLRGVLDKFSSSLGTRSDGRKKALTDKGYEAAVEFLSMFKDRNVLGDSQAQQLADSALKLINGAGAEELRSSDQFREEVRVKTELLTKQLDGYIQDGPLRVLEFD